MARVGHIAESHLESPIAQIEGSRFVGHERPDLSLGPVPDASQDRLARFGVGADHNQRHDRQPSARPGNRFRPVSWEAARAWHLVRPLVYYLIEDFAPPEMAVGAEVLDFSAGLGDLSRYLVASGAASVVATVPEPDTPRPDAGVEWRAGIAAGQIVSSFDPATFDLAMARMVFQFPTWEGDAADPDTLTEEFAAVVRPGGRLVIAFHEFLPFQPVLGHPEPPSVEDLLEHADPGRAALVRYLGLPPREGPSGESGFGLKVPMLVTTLQGHGFDIETADHPEPFTFPTHLDDLEDDALAALGNQVMAVKRKYLVESGVGVYERPGAIKEMLVELGKLYAFVTWPIVRIVARRR